MDYIIVIFNALILAGFYAFMSDDNKNKLMHIVYWGICLIVMIILVQSRAILEVLNK